MLLGRLLVASLTVGMLFPVFAFAATCPNLPRTLQLDERGEGVTALQQFLVDQRFLSSINVTGYFNIPTQQALQNWQTSRGIVSSGSPSETGWGVTGPRTRAAIASCASARTKSTPTVVPKTTPANAPTTYTSIGPRALSFGARGSDVIDLQNFLIAQNLLAPGNNTGYFGALTQAAVQAFQRSRSIVSSGSPDSIGYGAVGPRTRAAIQSGGSVATTVTYTPPPTTTVTPPCCKTIEPTPATQPTNVNPFTVAIASKTCTWNNQTIQDGSSVTAYQTPSVPFGQTCTSEQRTCSNGTLSGTYQNNTCTTQLAAACSFNGQTIQHNASITAYQASLVAYGSQCVSQQRTCSNGTLSGTYANVACTTQSAQLGQPVFASNQFSDSSNRFTAQQKFPDASGAYIPSSQILSSNERFTRGVGGYFVGMREGTNRFYLWEADAGGAYGTFTNKCEGFLVNRSDTPINADDLAFLRLADLDGDGVEELVGFQKHNPYVLAWSIAGCGAARNYQPLEDSYLYAKDRTRKINVDDIRFVIPGYFSDQGKETLIAITADSTFYEFGFGTVGTGFWALREGAFPVSNIRYAIDSKLFYGSGVPGPGAVLALSDSQYVLWDGNHVVQQGTKGARTGKLKLVFSMDQAFPNGLISRMSTDPNGTKQAIKRIAEALAALQPKYDVYAVFLPIVKDRAAFTATLDEFQKYGIPFMLEAYSSDVYAQTHQYPSSTDAYDGNGGEAIHVCSQSGSMTDPHCVEYYKARYGSSFAALRIFETSFFLDNYNSTVQLSDADFHAKLASAKIAHEKIDELLVRYASQNNMFVMWSDPMFAEQWACYATPQKLSQQREVFNTLASLREAVSRSYGATVIQSYGNNHGVEKCRGTHFGPRNMTLMGWESESKSHGSPFGLSDQSWIADSDTYLQDENVPPEEIAIWALDAQQKGASLIEFEPFWYLFSWPRAIYDVAPQAPLGTPTYNLLMLEQLAL